MNPALNLALSTESNIRRANPTTIKNKFLVGYQGWFNCHGDGEPVGPGHHGWIHWFTYPVPDGGALNTDYWPDTSQYTREERFVAPGFKHKDGSPAHLFSSRNPKTVQRHFHWMAENGVDGAFLQRFVGLCDVASGGNDRNRSIRDEVGDNVQRAAEREGRVYAIMYDVTDVQPERIQEIIEEDWNHLLQEKRVLKSPNYLREDGKPVIAIWGLGFHGRNHTIDQVRALTSFFKNSTPGGAYLMAGAPAHWRTSDSDADRNPEFVDTWLECFDAISPWTVGRYSDQASADAFAEDRIQGDVMHIARWTQTHFKRVDYVPVVHPGGSGYNMSDGQWARNGAPREGGRFLWRQIYNARKWGARIMYGAMWDEYDEGTQFMPAITKSAALPQDETHRHDLIAYDVDGYDVPPDWYMRIAGYGSALTKDELFIEDRFPEKVFRDWETKYESRPTIRALLASGSGSAGPSGQGRSYVGNSRTALETEGQDEDDAAPPPYSPNAQGGSGGARANTVPSRGPEPPVMTRPDLSPQDSRPPPAVPPRPNSQPRRSPTPQFTSGVAPAIPLASRPSIPSTTATPPRSPVSLERGPSTTSHHGQAHPTPHHLSATQPAPAGPSYPQYMPSPHTTPSYAPPTVPPPMSNYSQLPQPGNPWYPSPDTQPAWPQQGWGYPNPMAPAHFPAPGQPLGPYGYPGAGYDDPYAFPNPARPVDYPFAMPQAAPILQPQQLNPGPPPAPRPHSSNSGSEHAPHAHQHSRPSSARPSPPPPPPHKHHYDPLPHPPPSSSPSSSQAQQGRPQKESLIQRLGSVSAASSKVFSKFTK